MMKVSLVVLVSLVLPICAQAQDLKPAMQTEKWEAPPIVTSIPKQTATADAAEAPANLAENAPASAQGHLKWGDKENAFIGGNGIRKLGQQLAFPFTHPVVFSRNCTYPARHPMAFGQKLSTGLEPYDHLWPAVGAAGSLATPIGLKLWTRN